MADAAPVATEAADPLAAEFPTLHPAERRRFLAARDGDTTAAAKMLHAHLAWRSSLLPLPPDAPRIGAGLPVYAWTCPGTALDGTVVLCCQPSLIDPDIASEDAYIAALSEVLDATFDRASEDKCTVLLDTRKREGAPNVPGIKMMGIGKKIARVLSDEFPERMARLVVYPVPSALSFIWGLMKPFLAPKTAAKIVLLNGADGQAAPCPKALADFVSLETFGEDDQKRHAALAVGS